MSTALKEIQLSTAFSNTAAISSRTRLTMIDQHQSPLFRLALELGEQTYEPATAPPRNKINIVAIKSDNCAAKR